MYKKLILSLLLVPAVLKPMDDMLHCMKNEPIGHGEKTIAMVQDIIQINLSKNYGILDQFESYDDEFYDVESYSEEFYDEEFYDDELYDEELFNKELYDEELFNEKFLYEVVVFLVYSADDIKKNIYNLANIAENLDHLIDAQSQLTQIFSKKLSINKQKMFNFLSEFYLIMAPSSNFFTKKDYKKIIVKFDRIADCYFSTNNQKQKDFYVQEIEAYMHSLFAKYLAMEKSPVVKKAYVFIAEKFKSELLFLLYAGKFIS